MTLAEASSKKDIEYDLIDDVGLNKTEWEDGSYAKLQRAIAFAYDQEKEDCNWMNLIAFYLIQLFQSGKFGKSQLKQIYKSNAWSQRLLPLFYEMYIPESLWKYIMGSMKNIISDILKATNLNNVYEAHYRKLYTRHAFDIVTSKDVMMMINKIINRIQFL